MKYNIRPSSQFKKDLKLSSKRGKDISLINNVIKTLASGNKLDDKFKDHALIGEFANCRECHIQPDWLLIYEHDKHNLYLYLLRTGSHSDLFGK